MNSVTKKSNLGNDHSGHCFDQNGRRQVCQHEKKSKYQDKLLYAFRRKDTKGMNRINELEKEQQQTRAIIIADKK